MAFFSRPQASAAVKIVNPNIQEEPAKFPSRKGSDTIRQCRNIVIYGHCKFQDQGCVYHHPGQTPPPADIPTPGVITAEAVKAPVFVPKAAAAALVSRAASTPPVAPASPSRASPAPQYHEAAQAHDGYDNYEYGGEQQVDGYGTQMSESDPQYYEDPQYNGYSSEYQNGELAYYNGGAPLFMRETLNYHLYTPAIPPAFTPSSTDSHFVPPSSDLRQLLQSRSETIRGMPPIGLNLPEQLQGYHTLVPLDATAATDRRKFGNWLSTVYRAISSADGRPYALRRIENYRMIHQAAFNSIEAWSNIRHPNIVSVREAFTTRAFNDNSMVVAYAYHSGAQTLHDTHFKVKPPTLQQGYQHRSQMLVQPQPTTIPERTMWSYIIQIASAIQKVHASGLAVRMIDASKILVTGQNRLRIASCGIMDVLMYDTPSHDMHVLQQEDLLSFGRLIFALCCNNPSATSGGNFQKSLEVMARLYSPDMKAAALFLISKPSHNRNIGQLFEMINKRIVLEMDDALDATDRLEHELLSELENARLVRLLCKFGFINERPEFALDPRWSETGDRYIIKLFRDYVFHQVDETGNPVTNLSHVLTCLNKLDAGTDERIMLIARDEQSCLVVSYKEIKSCIESAFSELSRGSTVGKSNGTLYGR